MRRAGILLLLVWCCDSFSPLKHIRTAFFSFSTLPTFPAPCHTAQTHTCTHTPAPGFRLPLSRSLPVTCAWGRALRLHASGMGRGRKGVVMQAAGEAEDFEFDVKVRLVMLRSPVVQWYNGPDKLLEDEDQILRDFRKYVEGHKAWKVRGANSTGVWSVHPSPDGVSDRDVHLALLGIQSWRTNQIARDTSCPNEPFMELIVSQKDYVPFGLVLTTCEDFTQFATKFSGMSWTSMDVPPSGFAGSIGGDDPTLDQASVTPPTSCASVQKAIPEEDRPFFDTSALTDWLLPELRLKYDDEDLGVAGTTPFDGREFDEIDFGIAATEGRVTAEERSKYEAGGTYGLDPFIRSDVGVKNEFELGNEYDFVEETEDERKVEDAGVIDAKAGETDKDEDEDGDGDGDDEEEETPKARSLLKKRRK